MSCRLISSGSPWEEMVGYDRFYSRAIGWHLHSGNPVASSNS
jgi:hypothetical protein